MNRRLVVAVAVGLGLLASAGPARAASGSITLGTTTEPSGSGFNLDYCSASLLLGQYADTPSTPYKVPAGGGAITQWQTNAASDTAGSSLTFVVLQPGGSGSYTVVGVDTETIPSSLPSNHVATFPLSTPIPVLAGDTFALYSATSSNVCDFGSNAVPNGDSVFASNSTPLPPTNGEAMADGGLEGGSLEVDVAATLVSTQDVGVQASSSAGTITAGGSDVLRSIVSNIGPLVNPITFTDTVPSGLQIQWATAGLGSCGISGQTVTCTITGLGAGQSATVDVVVGAATPGSYVNNVSVGSTVSDPNTANNVSSTTLVVAAATAAETTPQPTCTVIQLRRASESFARQVLKELGCTVKLVKKSSSIRKGLVIGTKQPSGTYAANQLVTVFVSSGRKAKRKRH